MICNLSNPYDLQKFKDYVDKLVSEKATVDIRKKNPNRTLRQNSYLHVILGWFACQYGCTLEQVKVDFYKRECNNDIFEIEKTGKNGNTIKVLRSSSDLTTEEMSITIERFRNWSASVAGIYIPSPTENQFIDYIQNEIDKNKVYL